MSALEVYRNSRAYGLEQVARAKTARARGALLGVEASPKYWVEYLVWVPRDYLRQLRDHLEKCLAATSSPGREQAP